MRILSFSDAPVTAPSELASKIDAFFTHAKTGGTQSAWQAFPCKREKGRIGLGGDKGVAAFAKAVGRTDENLRTTYDRLRELVRANKNLIYTGPYFRQDPKRLNGSELLQLCSLPGTADEVWAVYVHTLEQLKLQPLYKSGSDLRRDALQILEHALGAKSWSDVGDLFDDRVFDSTGRLLPDRNDSIWIKLEVPNDSFQALRSDAKNAGFVVEPGKRWGNTRDLRLGVPHGVDRAALAAAINGARCLMSFSAHDWLGNLDGANSQKSSRND